MAHRKSSSISSSTTDSFSDMSGGKEGLRAIFTWIAYPILILASLSLIHFLYNQARTLDSYKLKYYNRCFQILVVVSAAFICCLFAVANVIDHPSVVPIVEIVQKNYWFCVTLLGGAFYSIYDKLNITFWYYVNDYVNQEYNLLLSSRDAYYQHVVSYVTEILEKENNQKKQYLKYQKAEQHNGDNTTWARSFEKNMMEIKEIPNYIYSFNNKLADLEFNYTPKEYDEFTIRSRLAKNQKFPAYMMNNKSKSKKSYKLKLSPENYDRDEKGMYGGGGGGRGGGGGGEIPKYRSLILCDSDDVSILYRFHVEAILEKSILQNENKLTIYGLGEMWDMLNWEVIHRKEKRYKSSVILDEGIIDDILNDAKEFFDPMIKKRKYTDLNIPWRRGYLLYGPPGCGKSSFAEVLASELSLNIFTLNLSHGSLDDSKLAEKMRRVPPGSVILLEDVDAVSVDTMERSSADEEGGNNRKKKENKISFSGLLNAIDGVTAQEGSIFMMTTNHLEKLDEALIRPGRVDKKIEVRPASKYQLEQMFLRFFPSEISLARQFAASLPADKITMANLQGFFMEHHNQRDGARKCLNNLRNLQNNIKSDISLIKAISMYEYLERLNLEAYTPLFERLGIFNSNQLSNALSLGDISLDMITKVSFRLRFDNEALRLFKMIFSENDSIQETLKKETSLVEIPDVRARFCKFFKTKAEKATGEAPFIVRKNTIAREQGSRNSSADLSFSEDHDVQWSWSGQFDEDTLHQAVLSLENIMNPVVDPDGHESSKNKTISFYNLTRLLWNHPNQPVNCVESAKHYFNRATCSERDSTSFVYKEITPAEFLKRAGLTHLFKTYCGDCKTIRELFEHLREKLPDNGGDCDSDGGEGDRDASKKPKGGPGREGGGRGGEGRGRRGGGRGMPAGRGENKASSSKQVPGTIGIKLAQSIASRRSNSNNSDKDDKDDNEEESDAADDNNVLSEIIYKRNNTINGYYLDFSLYDIPRIINEFIVFYSKPADVQDNHMSETESLLNFSNTFAVGGAGFFFPTTAASSSSSSSSSSRTLKSNYSKDRSHQLEKLAYNFAHKCSNLKGISLVSLIEIKKYLKLYADPMDAVRDANIRSLLDFPIIPTEPTPDPSPPSPETFVSRWLRSIDKKLKRHANIFQANNIVDKKDLSVFGPIKEDTLERHLHISQLGDRMKIAYWHAKMCKDPPEYPDGFNDSEEIPVESSRSPTSGRAVSSPLQKSPARGRLEADINTFNSASTLTTTTTNTVGGGGIQTREGSRSQKRK